MRVPAAASNQTELDLSSPHFNAARYLAVTHAHTGFPELQTALTELRKTTSDKTAQLKGLVSAHFDQYLSCHEAVRALAADVSAHQKETEALVGDMQNLSRVADASLAVMLQRAREQRRIRHTLAVLARLRPILELTGKMKASLRIQDYDTLAIDYARLKHQSSKIANLAPPLKRVVTAGHEIAATANEELLRKLEDMSASVTDQKRAIEVLSALGLVEKPILTCLTKQFGFLECKLTEISAQDDTNQITSEDVMKECVVIAARFRNGLWGFICELFKPPTANATVTNNTITSVEAERVQQQAWNILSKCIGLLERHSSPPSAVRLKLLTEAFRQFRCLKKCPNAAALNTNIEKLNDTFCDKFRTTITLGYLEHVCQSARSELLAKYFEPVVTALPSFSSEISLGTSNVTAFTSVMSADSRTKVQRVLFEARQAFDVIRNASTVSSESKILLHRPLVFTTCATDVLQCWKGIWQDVGQVLLDVLDIAGGNSSHIALEKHFRDMLAEFLDKVVTAFAAEIAPPIPLEITTTGGGARVCILLAIVANCVELREKCLRIVDGWVAQLKYGNVDGDTNEITLEHGRAATSGTRALSNIVQNVEIKCMDIYSEVEMSMGEYPQCWDYIRSVTDPLTAKLAEFLQTSVQNLEEFLHTSVQNLEGTSPSSLAEWKRCHLLVEARFFQFALSDLMAESSKTQLEELEKQLVSGDQTTNAGHVSLLNQMKHQTKLYLLALQQ
ncbi:hypothetical protein PHMEG_000457 [Phytophthora megakarya]|uniref:Exocyst complex component n=1 Tax=Phytophthora megakarya TaxID=4795 RepID=A0A225X325_9STRA|nr:hypothetical protein PHMEG_000457 [Phytophthora megakarya]